MNTRMLLGGALVGALLVGAGCTFPSSGRMVPASQANQIQRTEAGTVVKVRPVTVEGRRTHLGQYGGAVMGGAVALPNGGVGKAGEAVVVAAASVAGAVVGEATEEYLTRQSAVEITVQLKDGSLVTIVQAEPASFQTGDQVHVIHSPGGARVAMALGI